jgi:hypothetical protein
MEDERLARQVALVGHGSAFLRQQLSLDAFHRHGVFHGHRLLFRARADGRLLADDFTLWLSVAQSRGARRLSLHHSAGFGAQAHGALLIAVHFDDHYQFWAVGDEAASWPAPEELPSAAYYGGQIDVYWRLDEVAGQLAVPATDWPACRAAILRDLQLAPGPARPFLNHHGDDADWANLPLFPYVPARPLPHQLLGLLKGAASGFANDSHPKNEDSDFHRASGREQQERIAWSERLAERLVELQLRCANDLVDDDERLDNDSDSGNDSGRDAGESACAAAPAVPPTDWAGLLAALNADLGKNFTLTGHKLLDALHAEQARIGNDCNFKNENSYYKHLNDEQAKQVDAWSALLDGWVTEVSVRCASEAGRPAGEHAAPPFARLPLPQHRPAPAAVELASDAGSGSEGATRPRGCLLAGLALLLAIILAIVL